MAVLKAASIANSTLALPAILAVEYATHHGVQVDITFEDGNNLGSDRDALELAPDTAYHLTGDAIFTYLQDLTSPPKLAGTAGRPTVTDAKALDKPMKELELHLTLRSYIVGYSLTVADVALWGVLRGNRVIVGLRRSKTTNPWLSEAVMAFNSRKQPKKTTGANYNIGLKNTENGIVCRFPPEPSGYLHIGHAKAALENSYFAHEYGKNRGTLICRFEDTNPSKESEEFREFILRDPSVLGVRPDRVSYSSDYFQQMYEACIGLIRSGKAYAGNIAMEIMQDQRVKGIASACRNMQPEESLAHFVEMKSGSQTGLQCPITAPEEALGLRKVEIWVFSRLNFVRTVLSKRKLTNDPRMPTVRGIRRRGCTIPALREFILKARPQPKYYKPKHKSPALGTKKVMFSKEIVIGQDDARHFKENERITLMNWGNAIVRKGREPKQHLFNRDWEYIGI
ncbi:hypothetical protein BDV26DRAFT_302124 [Aspergillus bertholletiae]|uniref:tRNA synthetases class I, catalytic domain-containing protein n=1 Tax=Aspergillus bertholletiae TaxID=1226010 RepID=A0A5N7AQR9_9EURO|nr:hypothetical protein BDV26DRAFT_302124 [Aspergillus bertholletiae]